MFADAENQIIAIISEVSGAEEEEIGPDTNLAKDLEIDSIKAIEIIVAIEKHFRISIRDEEIPKIIYVRDAIAVAHKVMQEKEA